MVDFRVGQKDLGEFLLFSFCGPQSQWSFPSKSPVYLDEILLLLPLEVGGQGVIAQCFCAGVN